MKYEFLNSSVDKDHLVLHNSDKINDFLLKNNESEIINGINFIASKEKFLYVHGFMGTGKRQIINYICDFLDENIVKLEYFCQKATVSDDILLAFSDYIDKKYPSIAFSFNNKIATLNIKFQEQISKIKQPIIIVIHSLDNVEQNNLALIKKSLVELLRGNNTKLIISTKALITEVLDNIEPDRIIFSKALTNKVFRDFLKENQIKATETVYEDFYKHTRGYYYYVALTIKIIQAMKLDLSEFLQKFNQSEMTFDSYLGITYINLIPSMIKKFFWFLKTVRHGVSLNTLAVYELLDEFSVEYLKTNLMIFQANEVIYVQDYFLQDIDFSIPQKTEIKLREFLINIYEDQLKAPLKERVLMISRQAMRAEIEYHNLFIEQLEENQEISTGEIISKNEENISTQAGSSQITELFQEAYSLIKEKKYTDAIDKFTKIIESTGVTHQSLVEAQLNLAQMYKQIEDYKMSEHFYELVEILYKKNKELINLNYLYYELTDLYYKMYKHKRAIEIIKKVIYSSYTPQSLLVSACTLLGNIYLDLNNSTDAYSYFKKALESIDEYAEEEVLADLYFKYALVNDDNQDFNEAIEYYNQCISVRRANPYKALAYANLGAYYYDNCNLNDALSCFQKAYELEKKANNYDGIYFNARNLAKIYLGLEMSEALDYLIEAKKSAEFINEDFYIVQSIIELGDYYYNHTENFNEALREYIKAENIANLVSSQDDLFKIQQRINDMKLRMSSEDFNKIKDKYARKN